jgi:luciferase family oxidoreductase group 1
MPEPSLALSVLDHSPVSGPGPVADALAHSTELAQLAERAGYQRFWVAEHHGRPWMAGSSPAVLIAHLAARTRSIRIGSGALLLSNYAPIAIAEQFGMMEQLHPGRIDLGLGRSAGTDPVTAHALNPARRAFDDSFAELTAFFDGGFPQGHPYSSIIVTPGRGHAPAMFLLGSGTHSARLAGTLGLPFAHGGHFAAANTDAALAAYRSAFRPTGGLSRPYAIVSVGVIAAPTDAEALAHGDIARRNLVRGLSDGTGPFLCANDLDLEPRGNGPEAAYVDEVLATHIVGGPDTVRDGLTALAAGTGADELMITTIMYGYADRLRSHQIVAEAMGLVKVP